MEEGQAGMPPSEKSLTLVGSSFNTTPTKRSWSLSLSSGETPRTLKGSQLLIHLHEGNEKHQKEPNAFWDSFLGLFRRPKPPASEDLPPAENSRQPRELIVKGRKQWL